MTTRDLSFSLAAAVLTSLFLYPTLTTTNLQEILPVPLLLVLFAFVIVSLIGMSLASAIGKKISFLWQVAKFAQTGVLNTAIDFGILNFLISQTQITSGTGIIPTNAISFTAALVNSYFWNKNWVFAGKSKANFLTFATVTIIGLLINTGVVYIITTYIPPIIVQSDTLWANLAKVAATGFSLVWNFLGYKLIVFKKK